MSKQNQDKEGFLLSFICGTLAGLALGFIYLEYFSTQEVESFQSINFSSIASLPPLVEVNSDERTLTIYNSSPDFCLVDLPFTYPFNGAQYYVESTNPETGTCTLDYLD